MTELNEVKNPWKDAGFANNCNPPDKRMAPDDYPEMLGLPTMDMPFDDYGGMTFLRLDDVKPSSYTDFGKNVPVVSGDEIVLEKHWERRGNEIHFRVGNVRAKSGFIDAKRHYRISNTKVLHNKGTQNIFVGEGAGNDSLTGEDNVFMGYNAGNSLTSKNKCTLIGSMAGESMTSGSGVNDCYGYKAGQNITDGYHNICIGGESGQAIGSGAGNIHIGVGAGKSIVNCSGNVIIGKQAAVLSTASANTTLVGEGACYEMTTADGNTAVGNSAGFQVTTGAHNILLGLCAGVNQTASAGVTTGSNNIILGYTAGQTLRTGDDNIIIGDLADVGSSAITNSMAIGKSVSVSANDTIVLGTSSHSVSIPGDITLADVSSGQITAATSSYPSIMGQRNVTYTNAIGISTGTKLETTGNMADGFGPAQTFYIEDDGGVENLIAYLAAERAGADDSGNLVLQTYKTGTKTGLVKVDVDGNLYITSQAEVRFYDNGNYVGFEAPALTADQIWVLPTADGSSGDALTTNGSGTLSWTSGMGGDVDGPASATDNAIARFDTTTGKLIQNSVITIADTTGDVAGMGTLGCGAITSTASLIVNSGGASGEIGVDFYSIDDAGASATYSIVTQSDAEGIANVSDLRIGIDESSRNLFISDRGDIATDHGIGAVGSPCVYLFDAAGSTYMRFNYLNITFPEKYQIAQVNANHTLRFYLTADVANDSNAFEFYASAGAELVESDAEQAFLGIYPIIKQTSTANYVGLLMDVTETSTGSGTNELMALRVATADKFTIDNSGYVTTGEWKSTVIAHEYGGLEADVNAYNGLVKISGGSTSAITDSSTNWDAAFTHVSNNGTDHGYIDQDLQTTASPGFATGVTIGNLTLANGSITDSSNAIDFGNEALSTSGTLSAGAITGTSFIIGGNTLTTTEWGNLDGQDQTVASGSSPTFAACSLGTGELTAGSINRASGTLSLEIGGTSGLDILSTYLNAKYNLFVNETTNTGMTLGLTVNQGAASNEILACKASTVAHGCTNYAETDTFGLMKQTISGEGGLNIRGITEGIYAFSNEAFYTTDNATKSTAGVGPLYFAAYKISGVGITDMGADANVMVVRARKGGSTQTVFIIDEDGDYHYDGADGGAFQNEDDCALVKELEDVLTKDKLKGKDAKKKDIFKKHEVVNIGNNEGRFVSNKKKNMLFMGAIRQLDERIKALEGA